MLDNAGRPSIVKPTVGQDGMGNDVTPQVSNLPLTPPQSNHRQTASKGSECLVLLAYMTAYHLSCLHTPACTYNRTSATARYSAATDAAAAAAAPVPATATPSFATPWSYAGVLLAGQRSVMVWYGMLAL
ncbi:hypothetical protein ANO14919_010140 [Xylariales sp. No.14919]|nr:hypothetical protein ANO14919_010140 [Xylariales sp. No.14919]